MGRIKFADVLGGIGIATQACINIAGRDNVDIVAYIDNETNNKYCNYIYNTFFDTSFVKQDMCTVDYKNIKDPIDICVLSFPARYFKYNKFTTNTTKIPRLFGEKYKVIYPNLISSAYWLIQIKRPKCIIIDYTFEYKRQRNDMEHNNFMEFISSIEKNLAYKAKMNKYNAKDFNTPQNRERVSVVIFDESIDSSKFVFPKGVATNKTIGDYILNDYDFKYVIDEDKVKVIENSKCGYSGSFVTVDDYITTISANYGFNAGWSAILKDENSYRLFTPREIFRFMGLNDDYYFYIYNHLNIKKDSDLYCLAGNSMIGTYYNDLFRQLLKLHEFKF